MQLTKSCTINPDTESKIVLNSLCYATRKLWNVANYERRQWKKDTGTPYPNWYDQKKRLKNHFWYKNLPSQSAQELLAVLHRSWKSFYGLVKTGGIENPKPPRYKHRNFSIHFLNNGFKIMPDNKVQLSLPKQLKDYLKEKYNFMENYLILDVPNHLNLKSYTVKTLQIKPLNNGKYGLFFAVDVEKPERKEPDYQKYMSIDIGVNNFLSCYLYNGKSSIYSGRQLLAINRYYDKIIGYYQSICDAEQASRGIEYPKQSKRVTMLYDKRRKQVEHLLHSMTRALIEEALTNKVEVIFIGDITNIRGNSNLGKKNNQKFHRLPFRKVIDQIKYKAELKGITVMDDVSEEYTSQTCSYCKEIPSKENARKSNRKYRGLYVCKDCNTVINADINGAVNIAKKYLEHLSKDRPVVALDRPIMYRFNGQSFVA